MLYSCQAVYKSANLTLQGKLEIYQDHYEFKYNGEASSYKFDICALRILS